MDLDVAVAVTGVAAQELRRRLHSEVERIEERSRLVVEALVRAACGGCVRGACEELVALRAATRVVATDVLAMCAPAHVLRGHCACEPKWGGVRCDTPLDGCTTDSKFSFY